MSFLLLLITVLLITTAVFLFRRFLSRRWYWSIPVGLIGFALFVASLGLLLSFLGMHMMCGEYVYPYQLSPDQQRRARVTEFDCGATTGFTSDVELHAVGFPTSVPSLKAKLDWRNVVFTSEQNPRLIQLIWTGNRELTIKHPQPRQGDSYECDSTWHDVHIKCETYAPGEHALQPQVSPSRWLW